MREREREGVSSSRYIIPVAIETCGARARDSLEQVSVCRGRGEPSFDDGTEEIETEPLCGTRAVCIRPTRPAALAAVSPSTVDARL